jgi:hypothetical protein
MRQLLFKNLKFQMVVVDEEEDQPIT